MTDAPLVTIGITCFNAADTIGRAIASAQAQDWPDLEIVVADDASSDNSAELVRERAASDPRIRLVVHETNGGAAVARNTILAEARGEFVAFFDDDDESLPLRVRRQVEVIEAAERGGARLVACYAGGERLYPNGYVVPAPGIGSAGEPPHGAGVANYLLFNERDPAWFYGGGTPTCALMARRSTFAAVGGFDPAFRRNQDIDLAVRIALAGGLFVGTRERLYVRHMTGGADKSPEAGLAARLRLAEKHAAYLKSVGRYYYATHWPRLRYQHFRRNYLLFLLEFIKIFLHNPIAASRHLLSTGPARLRHERRMREDRA